MAWHVWMEETTIFLSIIRDRKITTILDEKQQTNAATYQDLQAEMRGRGFQKLKQILHSKYKTIN